MNTVVERYIELGLRLGRHIDGFVDAYYGPAELARRVTDEALRPPDVLRDEAARLITDLDAGADDTTIGPARRRWIRAQVVGLHTSARKLAGEPISYLDEVEWCYGVRPVRRAEDEFESAHRTLDEVLPGSGPLAERYVTWRESEAVPIDRLREAIDSLAEGLRARTAERFGLPDGEHVDFELVKNQPWSGFNYYLGDLQSRVAVNTDLPVLAPTLAHLVAHEAYPGHHTEHSRKEAGLVRSHGHMEETIFLVGTPQCLMAEGLADLGLEVVVEDPDGFAAEHLRPLGISFDAEVVKRTRLAAETLGAVRGNVGMLLHEDGADLTDVVDYAMRWGLMSRERAEKSVEFMTSPTWRAYISCYVEGLPLCRSFVAGDPERFERLITEPLVPEDLVA